MTAERDRRVRTRAEDTPRRPDLVEDRPHPLLQIQRLAGNSAVAQVLQRESPTREQNISALDGELAAAETDASKWKDVALRLNGFERSDIARMAAKMKRSVRPAVGAMKSQAAEHRYL